MLSSSIAAKSSGKTVLWVQKEYKEQNIFPNYVLLLVEASRVNSRGAPVAGLVITAQSSTSPAASVVV